MAHEVEIHPAAQKQMLSLPKEAQVEVARSIDRLGNTPRPPRVKKLAESGLWRIRAGQHRLVYAVDDEAQLVTIARVARRKESTYKRL
ncbi:MAG: type II toxin-antitoxin system RelE/ParE family toxin [Chloroflexi bacterium]|nr:type II toxin-antitoxin system RelE/ParE family toxin [Chloroflexota bacterium]